MEILPSLLKALSGGEAFRAWGLTSFASGAGMRPRTPQGFGPLRAARDESESQKSSLFRYLRSSDI
jgi:hypothetical protein